MFLTYQDAKAAGGLWEGQYEAIPQVTREGMMAYVEDRKEPGGFLSAVICNDLLNAVCRADRENLVVLKEIVQWFYNVAPMGCSGSKQKMALWLKYAEVA